MLMQKFQVFWREKGQEFGRTDPLSSLSNEIQWDHWNATGYIVEGLAKTQELEGSLKLRIRIPMCHSTFRWMMVDGFGWIIMTSLLHHWNTGMMISKGNHL